MKILFTLLFLLLINNSYAVDKDLHDDITEEAFHHFKTCTNKLGGKLKLTDEDGGLIKDASKNEDNASFERLFNWHFYDHYRDTEHAMHKGYTLHRVFSRKTHKLEKAVKKTDREKYLLAAGSIIHYIQDMGIPAHVAPNYHAKGEGFLGKLFAGNEPDPLDSLMTPKKPYKEVSEDYCVDLLNKNATTNKRVANYKNYYHAFLNELLVELAEKTRASIQNTRLSNNRTFEHEFWVLRDPENSYDDYLNIIEGFSPYGIKNDRRKFTANYSPCNQLENKNICSRFVKERYQSIIDQTVRSLMFINNFTPDKNPNL